MVKLQKIDLYENGEQRDLFSLKGPDFDKSNDKKIFLVHDAHNFFDKKYTSYGGSWRIEDALDKLGITDYLVFGMADHKKDRMLEYSPVPLRDELVDQEGFTQFRGRDSFGVKYLNTLKSKVIPLIEKQYNFIFDKCTSLMIGSSMGGVITTYAAINNVIPSIDGYLSFSTALFANYPYMNKELEKDFSINTYFHSMGTKETSGSIAGSDVYLQGFKLIQEYIKPKTTNYKDVIVEGGVHNEDAWAKLLPEAISWALK